MNVSDLKSNYFMFGNKGAVWTKTAHIAKSGDPQTLCGTPMLSTNWARIEKVETIGCPKCIEEYNRTQSVINSKPHPEIEN